MNKIMKYEVHLGSESLDETVLSIPAGAQFLSIQAQAGRFVLWALVNTNNEKVRRVVYAIATSDNIPGEPALEYIATVQQGIYVWHFFEKLD